MTNAMSVDVEDWFCVSNLTSAIGAEDWDQCELRVVDNTRRLLKLFGEHQIEATFFVLGWIAERVPELVREIESQGHEIGTHGYSHRMITQMTPEEFEQDLKKALDLMATCTEQPMRGFRAPSFTITKQTAPWALDILARHGIEYDSSVFPIGLHPDYGIPDSPLGIHAITPSLTEVPLSCAVVLGKKIPCSGGGYFRIFPYAVTRRLIRRCNRQGRPVIFYLHPWEVDPGQPRVKLPWTRRFRHYCNLKRTERRLGRLLRDFQFTSIRNLLKP